MDLHWRKSSHSQDDKFSDCVEVALVETGAAIRDSKNPSPHLLLTDQAWAELRASLR